MRKLGFIAIAAASVVSAAVGCQLISGASNTKFVSSGGAGGVSATGGGIGGQVSQGGGGQGGQGGAPTCKEAKDCPGEDNSCTPRACKEGMCTTSPLPKNASCNIDGGKVCDDKGKCVGCNDDTNCVMGKEYCEAQKCRPLACKDMVQNGLETAIDCGGKECAPCVLGKGCVVGKDCKSGYCEQLPMTSGAGGAGGAGGAQPMGGMGGIGGAGGSGGVMATGVCLTCKNDQHCSSSDYCDKAIDQGTCVPKKKIGSTCATTGECVTGFCVDGFCCDKACTAECVSCAALLTGAANGTCTATKKGVKDQNECDASMPATCGANGNGCNGDPNDPHCALFGTDTVCVPQACKDAGFVTLDAKCDGKGKCNPGMDMSCAPYTCQNKKCLQTCMSHTDCASTHYCAANMSCDVKKTDGAACIDGNECDKGNCVDGFCCDKACAGACEACSKAKGANQDGTCKTGAVKDKTDPGACDAAKGCANLGCSCDSGGACKSVNGAKCNAGTDCVSGACADGVCCDTSCNGPCEACAKANGADQDGVCKSAAVKGTTDPGTCDTNNGTCQTKPCTCDMAGACKNDLGVACTMQSQCASGFCPSDDGVCCDAVCNGQCVACKQPLTGKPTGNCFFVKDGLNPNPDPGNDCLTVTHVCNGNGGCKLK